MHSKCPKLSEVLYMSNNFSSFDFKPIIFHSIFTRIYFIAWKPPKLMETCLLFFYCSCRILRTSANILVINLAISDFFMLAKTPIYIYNSIKCGPALGDIGKSISYLNVLEKYNFCIIDVVDIVIHLIHTYVNEHGFKTVFGRCWQYRTPTCGRWHLSFLTILTPSNDFIQFQYRMSFVWIRWWPHWNSINYDANSHFTRSLLCDYLSIKSNKVGQQKVASNHNAVRRLDIQFCIFHNASAEYRPQ